MLVSEMMKYRENNNHEIEILCDTAQRACALCGIFKQQSSRLNRYIVEIKKPSPHYFTKKDIKEVKDQLCIPKTCKSAQVSF